MHFSLYARTKHFQVSNITMGVSCLKCLMDNAVIVKGTGRSRGSGPFHPEDW